MALSLTELNSVTLAKIAPGVVDNNFLNDPLLAFLKQNVTEVFTGGAVSDPVGAEVSIREEFMYNNLEGDSYDWRTGATPFLIGEPRILATGQFGLRSYYVSVTIRKEVMQVFNKGPAAAISILDAKFVNAALSMSRLLATDLYAHGQNMSGSTGGSHNTDRRLFINGAAEVMNDGAAGGYEGITAGFFVNYGEVLRTDVSGQSGGLNSVPRNLSGNPIQYSDLIRRYNEAVIGPEAPNLGVTSNQGIALIKEAFQPQQFITSVDPVIGYRGLEFEDSRIIKSQYAPAGSPDDSRSISVASTREALLFFNTKYWRFWITDDPEFAFGFSGFKPAQRNNLLAGQYFFVGNVTCQAPRLQKQIFGFA